MSAICCPKVSVYKPRRPEKTVFFQVIKKYYKTWVKKTEQDDKKIPSYVHREFQGFIKCGILTYGFACAHCKICNCDFLLGFSCKLRLCPSCCARNMVETAAHLQENVIGPHPVRQWVISFPKRIRYYLQTDAILQKVLRIVVKEIKKKVITCSPKVTNPEFGAVSFIQRFGNTLNFHPHFHLIVADGVFEKNGDSFTFHEASLTPDDTSFASENLRWNGQWLNYRLPKPCHTGKTFITIDPVEFIDKIALLIPPARRHRHHYHGAFAPNSPLRPSITKAAIETPAKHVPTPLQEAAQKTSKVSFTWAKLIARIYEVDPLLCFCGKEMKIVKIVKHPSEIWRILKQIGWPTTTPEFDEPQDLAEWDICQLMPESELSLCQLVPGTADGFPEEHNLPLTSGPGPPACEFEDNIDPPHWEDSNSLQYD